MNIKQTLYKIIENKFIVIGILVVITILLGIVGFAVVEKKNFYDTVMGIFDLFLFESIEKYNGYIFTGRIFALITIFFGVLSFFIYRFSNYLVLLATIKSPYTLVVGMGNNNRHYLNSESDNSKNIVVVEKDADNPYINRFITKGFGIKIGDILNRDIFDKLQLKNVDSAIISTGSDKRNLEVLVRMIEYFDELKHKRLYVHLEDFKLKSLFTEEIIEHKNSEIITFSFFELAVQKLLQEHSILGNKPEIAQGSEAFSVAIVGNGDLALQLVYQLANLAHLPNENRLTIYCVDKEAEQFIEKVKNSFIHIDEIETLELKAIAKDVSEVDFYEDTLWKEKNLTNIFVTKEEEEENFNIALDFYNKCYIKVIGGGSFRTKVLFASYKYKELAKSINENSKKFKNFYTFANASEIFRRETLLNEELDRTAKLIHHGYGDIYEPKVLLMQDDKIDKKWFQEASLNDKVSSRMQGMHIDVKLLALGLKKVKSKKTAEELLEVNQKLFREKLGEVDISDEELLEYSKELTKAYSGEKFEVLYFPKKFNSLFEKLIRSEHNRWNAYHYLHGWSYSPIKNKAYKEHDCLLPLDKFDKPNIQLSVIYDIYAVLYLPNILAGVGYVLVEE
jgi:hypothetical protein